jgi:5-oxoprolinase (ATP-hydrolysing) subunit B
LGGETEERDVIVRRAGDSGLLVQLPATVTAARLHAMAEAVGRLEGVVRCTPGHSSLLVIGDALVEADVTAAARSAEDARLEGVVHELQVDFSEAAGPDLPRLLAHAAISRPEFLDRIASIEFVARFLGFRPGFAYLEGVPLAWQLPRLATPRPAVPAGSFGFAGEMAGFYPAVSPGGWNLLGACGAVFWDAARRPPNLISPGDRVRVVPLR